MNNYHSFENIIIDSEGHEKLIECINKSDLINLVFYSTQTKLVSNFLLCEMMDIEKIKDYKYRISEIRGEIIDLSKTAIWNKDRVKDIVIYYSEYDSVKNKKEVKEMANEKKSCSTCENSISGIECSVIDGIECCIEETWRSYVPRIEKSCSSFKSQTSEDYIDTINNTTKVLKEDMNDPVWARVVFDDNNTDKKELNEITGTSSRTRNFICRILPLTLNGEAMFIGADVSKIEEDDSLQLKTDNEIQKLKIKGGNDMSEKEKVEKEIEKVKELIEKVKEERKKTIENSYFKKAITEHSKEYGWVCKFNKDFIHILKNEMILSNLDKKIYKKLKNFKYRTSYSRIVSKIIEYKKEEWKEFLEILEVVNKYWNNFILSKEKKELCRYTDCYKELATEKFCEKCASSNPIEAVYCNHCGEQL